MTKFYLFSRYCTVLLFLTMLSTEGWSQGRIITGTVTAAEDGTGLPGVNILEKGTSNGTITSADGSYSISVGDNATLVFSFVGYKSTELPVGSQSSVSVALNADVTALSEVVVIGYGEVNKRDATGAVTSVSAKDFNAGLISSPEQLIQGKTAGVQMTSASGNPGDGVQLRIRGTNSIRSNNNPLFVVDGVPLAGGTQPAAADVGFGTTGDTNPMNFLNPSDIESISILKDASATAIYGSRGANGVVIITTKKGRGASGFEFGSQLSVSTPRNKYDLLDREEFLDGVEQYGGDRNLRDSGGNTDWQDYILRTSVSHKQNLAYSRGFKTGSVRASVGYENQQGILENSYMKRFTGKINAGKSFLNDALKLDLSTTYSKVNREDPPISGNSGFQGDLIGAAYSANPTWYDSVDFNPGGQRSPANMLAYYKSTGATDRVLANLSADYKIAEGLSAKLTYGVDWANADRVTLLSGKAVNAGNGVTGFGTGQLNENKNINHLFEGTLTYNKKAGAVDINFVGGYSVQSFRNQWMWATGKGFTDYNSFTAMEDELRNSYDAGDAAAQRAANGQYNNWGISDDLRAGGNTQVGGAVSGVFFDDDDNTFVQSFFPKPAGVTLDGIAANFYDQTDYLQSYFARGNFTFNDKYLVTLTVRADGSSKFGDENKYGIFPSGAVAWQIHEEEFLPESVSTLKLRVGYGVVGNQDGLGYGNFLTRRRYADMSVGDSREVNVPGLAQQGFRNNGLKWEETSQLGIGIDFGIINDRLSGSIDWYKKETTDLLMRFNAPQPSPTPLLFRNLDATVENKGWELSLSYAAIEGADRTLTISGNIARNENMVKNFAGVFDAGRIYGQGLSEAFAQRVVEGQPLFSYFLRSFEGFDENGQPISDDLQKFVGKSALPTWNAGLSINGTFNRFDFAMYFSGQFGHYIYNNTRNAYFTAGSINVARNVTPDVLTSGESGAAEAAVSERFVEKGDFVRMQNLSFGYALVQGGEKIKNLRLSLNLQNLFVITNYSGLDPEVSSNPANYQLLNDLPTAGIDYAAYPRPTTFALSLNATF